MISKAEFFSLTGLRPDGRRPHEPRRLRCKFGLFSRVDGSAYLEQGNTKVVAVVYGPREVKKRSDEQQDDAVITCEYSQQPFSTSERREQRSGDRKAVEYSLGIKRIFEGAVMTKLFPRTQIDVHVNVIQADGGQLCAAINAVTLALMDAGVPMKDFVVACSAGTIENTPITDLNHTEESGSGPVLSLAMMPSTGKLLMSLLEARTTMEEFQELVKIATAGCKHIYEVLKGATEENNLRLLHMQHGV